MRLQICVPICRDVKAGFLSSLCGLVHRTASATNLEAFDMYIMQGASVLPKARQLALRGAIEKGFTHVLFLDDDMSFQPDLLEDSARHNLPIVGINYTRKTESRDVQTHGLDGQPVYSFGKSGIEEVGWIGFGGVLIELAAIKEIADPLFEMRWMPDRNDFVGEDYYFCGKVRAQGVSVYVDHDASNKSAHIGDMAYREIVAQTPIFDFRETQHVRFTNSEPRKIGDAA